MNKIISILFLFFAYAFAVSYVNDFLDIDADHIALSLGGSRMSSEGSSALFGNPARIFSSEKFVHISHEQIFDGLAISDAGAYRFSLGEGRMAVGFIYVGGKGINVTALPDSNAPISPQNIPYIVEEKGHHDFAILCGYSLPVKQRVSVGASGAIIYRNLVDKTGYGLGTSFGAEWKPTRDLSLGSALRNTSFVSWQTGANEFGAPSVALAGRYDRKLGANFAGALCLETQYLLQSQTVEVFGGAEIIYANIIAIRGGIKNGAFTAGAELKIAKGLRIGASLNRHEELPISYRIGLTLEKANE